MMLVRAHKHHSVHRHVVGRRVMPVPLRPALQDEVVEQRGRPEPEPVLIITIKGALQAAESRLKEQSEVYGPNHPTFQRTQAEVESLRERLHTEAKKVVASLGNGVAQSQKRVDELQASAKEQQERIMKMREGRVDLAVLTRDMENAQRAYDT